AIPFIIGAEVEISKLHEANDPAEVVVQVEESQPAPQRRLTPTGTPQKRAKRASDQTIVRKPEVEYEDRRAQPGTADNPISDDELAALDADNKRLKRLLAERLRAQNLRLKKMLERFDG
ncbi:hypothetical protein, partial [Sinorhizobium meliloti]